MSDYYTPFLAVDLPPDLPEPVLQELRWLVGQDEMPSEFESERASPEIAPALAAIRTLDLKVVRAGLSGATAQRYLSLQETVYCGKRAKPPPAPARRRVTIGLWLIRTWAEPGAAPDRPGRPTRPGSRRGSVPP
ncbi:hypothetical protein [Streptomyces umbrinus]|uniref:hypothetical protein n=1 Tax=Streptomyces umbrinus TaxID=67370 RepID=UPI00341A883B